MFFDPSAHILDLEKTARDRVLNSDLMLAVVGTTMQK